MHNQNSSPNSREKFISRVTAYLSSGTGLIFVRTSSSSLWEALDDTSQAVATLLGSPHIRAARVLSWSPEAGLMEGLPAYASVAAALRIGGTGKVSSLDPRKLQGLEVLQPKVLEEVSLPDAAGQVMGLLAQLGEGNLLIFFIFIPGTQLGHPATVGQLLGLARQAEIGRARVLLFITNEEIPDVLQPISVVEDHPRPDRERILREMSGVIAANLEEAPDFSSPEWAGVLASAARILGGLTTPEIRQATAEALLLVWQERSRGSSRTLEEVIREIPNAPEAFLRRLLEEKAQLVRRHPALEWAWPEAQENLGGFARLKRDLRAIAVSFAEEAEELGIRPARGIFLVGPPGTGKSLAARVIAGALGFPMFRLDIGALFGPLLGQTEAAVRDALAAVSAAAPCVLLVDEVDKGLGGVLGGLERDGGTAHRVLGTLLTWLQEDRSPVLVVMTANRISGLPPELLDRMPYTYGVGLPGPKERREILAIHLRRRGQALPEEALARLAAEADGRSGRSIEAAVEQGILQALSAGRLGDPAALEAAIREALRAARPVSETMPEAVAELEQVARRFPFVNEVEAEAEEATSEAPAPAQAARRRRILA
jgi:MoxR-like ATPase